MSDLKDKAWLTMKSRMFSERRLRKYHILSYILIVSSSLLILINSVWLLGTDNQTVNYNLINVSLSLVVFSMSLIVVGVKFDEKANVYRRSYLEIQGLLNSNDLISANEYNKILDRYPNHSTSDYEAFIIEEKIKWNNELKIGEKNIEITRSVIFLHFTRIFVFYLAFLSFFTIIILVGTYPMAEYYDIWSYFSE